MFNAHYVTGAGFVALHKVSQPSLGASATFNIFHTIYSQVF